MIVQCDAITHPGGVRRTNEDAFLLSRLAGREPRINVLEQEQRVGPGGLLAAVADGLGGGASGEVASREALVCLELGLFGRWGRFPAAGASEAGLLEAFRAAAREAGAAVLRYADDDPPSRGMSATLAAALLWGADAFLLRIGDCRAYLYRNRALALLTPDPGEAAATEGGFRKGLINQALGIPLEPDPVLSKVALCRGDRLLLCSDGLHRVLGEAGIRDILALGHAPRWTTDKLFEAALALGAPDNLTAMVLALDDPALPLSGAPPEVRLLRESRSGPFAGLRRLLGRSGHD